mmetsp:Transcript_32138/g.54931  ORF Transcript_32138/g.54931 Transcript_32138/m.54931 type:complete len:219 (+) Transcript_32138:42-698(+)
MNRIFGGKKKAPPPPSLDEATQQADGRIQRINQKISQLDSELRTIREQMKRVRPGPAQNSLKQRAMRVLKQKKMYEGQRDSLMGTIFNMEQANFTTQSLQDTTIMVSAMKAANATMKQQFKSIDIDSVEDLYDDMAELMEENDMIQEAMSRSFSTPEDLDEADLEAELDALGDELLMGEDEEQIPSYLIESASIPSTIPEPEIMEAPEATKAQTLQTN